MGWGVVASCSCLGCGVGGFAGGREVVCLQVTCAWWWFMRNERLMSCV